MNRNLWHLGLELNFYLICELQEDLALFYWCNLDLSFNLKNYKFETFLTFFLKKNMI